jgi:hypothetical protein
MTSFDTLASPEADLLDANVFDFIVVPTRGGRR